VLLLVLGGLLGLFDSLAILVQQIMCPSGYPNTFGGFCLAVSCVGGVFGSMFAGTFVDWTHYYEETLKVSMIMASLFCFIFLELSLYQDMKYYILVVSFLFGAFGMASYLVGVKFATGCTQPVSEHTTVGIVAISGQIQSFLYLLIMSALAANPHPSEGFEGQVCTVSDDEATWKYAAPNDMRASIIVISIIAASLTLILNVLFHPKYRRPRGKKRDHDAREPQLDAREPQQLPEVPASQ